MKKSKHKSKKKSKKQKKARKVLLTKIKVVKPPKLPVHEILKHMLGWVKLPDLLAYISTRPLDVDIWHAEWEVSDHEHYLGSRKDTRFRSLSKRVKIKMKKDLKYWRNCLLKLREIRQTLEEVSKSYQKLCIPKLPQP